MISPEFFSSGAVLATLAQVEPAIRDTVVTVQASSRGLTYWVDLLTSIASILIALALIAMAITVIPAAWNSRKVYAKINQAIEKVQQGVDPVVRHAASVADNVDYISAALRADVQLLNQTIASANQRVDRAAALAEQRVNELNALLEVVQEEAEALFIDTASTVRGVRTGAEAFRRFRADVDADLVEDEDVYDDLDGRDDGLDTGFGRRG